MPTTAAGTAYTVTSFVSSAGEPCRRAIADSHALDKRIPLIIFCHGNPGTDPASADFQFGAGYTTLRERIINNGYAYVEGHGAGANWGNAQGRAAYRAMYQDVLAQLDIGWNLVIGRSMGALVGAYLASRDPVISPRCAGFVSLSGTADLSNRYSRATTSEKPALLAAYNATDEASFRTAVADFDPMLFSPSVWDQRKAIMQWDTSDTTVPYLLNGKAWQDRYGSYLAVNSYYETSGGDHNTSPNNPAQIAATISFIETALSVPWVPPTVDPIPTTADIIRKFYLVKLDGSLQKIVL